MFLFSSKRQIMQQLKSIASILLLFLVPLFLSAQPSKTWEITGGGFGHFQIGPAFSDFDPVERYVNNEDLLGGNVSMSGVGLLTGGQGFGIVSENILIGGSGFSTNFSRHSGDNGTIEADMSGGRFNLGYMFFNRNAKLGYLVLGIGGSSTSFTVNNLGQDPIPFDQNSPLPAGSQKSYSLTGTSYEVGVSYKQVLHGKDNVADPTDEEPGVGGFMLGLDVGVNYNLISKGWGDGAVGAEAFNPYAIYARVTIGGGGFSLK